MYVVIFEAEINTLDEQYLELAQRLRDTAITQFGCCGFNSALEDNREITVSYWPDLESIKQWKNHKDHRLAQELGRQKYYKTYSIKVAEVKRPKT